MPLEKDTRLASLPSIIQTKIIDYDGGNKGAVYNCSYRNLIQTRSVGTKEYGNLGKWISSDEAGETVYCLLDSFGMNVQKSKLADVNALIKTLKKCDLHEINWLNSYHLPLEIPLANIVNQKTNMNLADTLSGLYDYFAFPGRITISGGVVASSKTMHCLFPRLCPMIDGRHTGLSYYHIQKNDYVPPLKCDSWKEWIGQKVKRKLNPSPNGAGRKLWQSEQYLAAIGMNQKIYELWKGKHQDRDLKSFIELDNGKGATGIPRIVDKLLW